VSSVSVTHKWSQVLAEVTSCDSTEAIEIKVFFPTIERLGAERLRIMVYLKCASAMVIPVTLYHEFST
jgi:hypothetical protein